MCSRDDIEARIDDRACACRIVDIRFDYSLPRLLVKIWLPESELPTGADTLPSLNPSTDGRIIGMCGVLHSNWLHWITTESVTDFAYIIHHKSLLSGMYANVFGMRNAYFCRYDIFSVHVQSHLVRKYEAESHKPFSHLFSKAFPESSHHRFFQFMTELKRNADKVLWTKRKFSNANGIGRALPFFINKECWDYFVTRLGKDPSYEGYSFDAREGRRTIKIIFTTSVLKLYCSKPRLTALKPHVRNTLFVCVNYWVLAGATVCVGQK